MSDTALVMSWSPAGGADSDIYWLSLSQWISAGDTIASPPVVTVQTFTGDTNPLVASNPVVDTGSRTIIIPPGVPYVDAGPRLQITLSGGTPGKTYQVAFKWTDSQGRTITRLTQLPIQW